MLYRPEAHNFGEPRSLVPSHATSHPQREPANNGCNREQCVNSAAPEMEFYPNIHYTNVSALDPISEETCLA